MNFIIPDHFKEEALKIRSALHSMLSDFRMIAKGKKLHTRYSAQTQPRSIGFVQDTSKVFRD